MAHEFRVIFRRASSAVPLDDEHRVERKIAFARVFAAAAASAAIVAARSSGAFDFSLLLLGVYGAIASAGAWLADRQSWSITRHVRAIHAGDVAVAGAVMLTAAAPATASFLLMLFAIMAAAYRWGFVESAITTLVALMTLAVQAAAPTAVRSDDWAVPAAQLLFAGLLIGFLGEMGKRARLEASAIAAIVHRADARAGLQRTMTGVLDAIRQLFGARSVVLAVYETASDQLFLWEFPARDDRDTLRAQISRCDSGHLPAYMFEPGAAAWHVVRRGPGAERLDVVALDGDGVRLKANSWAFPAAFLDAVPPFRSMVGLNADVRNDWTARVFLIDPRVGAHRAGTLELGRRLVRELTPAMHNVYLLRRVRAVAAAAERARIARELHDGVIQAVMGVELQVAALSRRFATESPAVAAELTRFGTVLRQEVVGLREQMDRMKPLDFNPSELVDALADSVQRFERETGIAARFVTQLDRLALPAHACREVARILSEGLVNVRRHSGARHVWVRLDAEDGSCSLSINDDGRGFPFVGRLSQADLEATRKGPAVIRERVRLLGGRLTVESDPGRGARLEITVPVSTHASH